MADDFINSLGGGSSGPPEGAQPGGGTNAGSTADILRNQVLSQLVTVLSSAFPQASASITHTATAGADTLPAKPAGFLSITVGGTAFKVPLYT